jgi:hypothetical protein
MNSSYPTLEQAKARYEGHSRLRLNTDVRKRIDLFGMWTVIDGYPAIVDTVTGFTILHFRKLAGSRNLVFAVVGNPDWTVKFNARLAKQTFNLGLGRTAAVKY